MPGPVGTHLVLGREDLAAAPLAGEVPGHVDVRVVVLSHGLRPEHFATFLAGETLAIMDILRLSPGVVGPLLSGDHLCVFILKSSRKLRTSFLIIRCLIAGVSSADVFLQVVQHREAFLAEVTMMRIG